MKKEKFESAPKDVLSIVKHLRHKHYHEFKKVTIITLMRNGKWNKYGTIQVVSEAQRKAGIHADYILTLNAGEWKKFSEKQKKALVDHELAHMVKRESKSGTRYRCRHHSVEEFNSIVERYGAWSPALEKFKKSLNKK